MKNTMRLECWGGPLDGQTMEVTGEKLLLPVRERMTFAQMLAEQVDREAMGEKPMKVHVYEVWTKGRPRRKWLRYMGVQ